MIMFFIFVDYLFLTLQMYKNKFRYASFVGDIYKKEVIL